MSKISQSAEANVVTLIRQNGRLFVLKRVGNKVRVRAVEQRQRPRTEGVCLVLPFPARGR